MSKILRSNVPPPISVCNINKFFVRFSLSFSRSFGRRQIGVMTTMLTTVINCKWGKKRKSDKKEKTNKYAFYINFDTLRKNKINYFPLCGTFLKKCAICLRSFVSLVMFVYNFVPLWWLTMKTSSSSAAAEAAKTTTVIASLLSVHVWRDCTILNFEQYMTHVSAMC